MAVVGIPCTRLGTAARHSILKKRSTNRGTHLASASTHEAMFAPCVLPVVARGAYVAPLRAGSSRRRPRPARSVRSRATVPVRSASSSAESDFDDLSDVTRDVLAFHAAERNGNGDRGRHVRQREAKNRPARRRQNG